MERGRPRGRAPRPADRAALEAPPPPDPPRWRFWPVLFSVIAAFAAAFVAVIVVGVTRVVPVQHIETLTPAQISLLTLAQYGALTPVLLALLGLWPKLRPGDLGLTARPSLQLGVAVGAGVWVASILIATALDRLFGSHPQALIVAASADRSVEGLVLDIVFQGAFVGFVEELLFRAVLFTLFRQRMRFIYAAVLSSAVFALVHEITAWLPVFVIGFALAFLYEKRRSLWTNALAHGTFNSISFVLLLLLPDHIG